MLVLLIGLAIPWNAGWLLTDHLLYRSAALLATDPDTRDDLRRRARWLPFNWVSVLADLLAWRIWHDG